MRLLVNEYGTPVSLHTCWTCGSDFTVCPAIAEENADDWTDCMARGCASYDRARDADRLFEEESWRIQREEEVG